MTANVRALLDELDSLHHRVIRDDRGAEWLRLTQEHDALPDLIAAVRAVLDLADDLERQANSVPDGLPNEDVAIVGKAIARYGAADRLRAVVAAALAPAVQS